MACESAGHLVFGSIVIKSDLFTTPDRAQSAKNNINMRIPLHASATFKGLGIPLN